MIAGVGPNAFASPSRALRWGFLAGVAVLAAWAGGDLYDRISAVRSAEAAAIRLADARADEAQAFADARGAYETRIVRVGVGETLAGALKRAGASAGDIGSALATAARRFDVRKVGAGQTIRLVLDDAGRTPRLASLAFHGQPGTAITVYRGFDGAFRQRTIATPLTWEVTHLLTRVNSSISASVAGGGAGEREIRALQDIFRYDVDFQRDIRRGDPLEMLFWRQRDEDGATVKTGDLLYVSLPVDGRSKAFYRFKPPGASQADFYDITGKSARKFLMKTPINGARMSSGFGMRLHPILGYSILHKGTDFAVPTGTPIMAAGDGVVEKAGPFSTYGNYVRIKHGDGYETAYAHMSRYAKGVRAGARVRQGQVIGYVGTTGRSTGPHLHYEVLLKGVQTNPMRLNVRTGRNLEPGEMRAFLAERQRIDSLRLEEVQTASADPRRSLSPATVQAASDLRGLQR